jgi:FkbM family methyltransferase
VGLVDMQMTVRHIGKMIAKKPLNVLGFDIVRLPSTKADVRVFEPSEANKFIWLSALNINTVIDIGAHTGEFATKIHGILPNASILSFEPLEEPFKQLQANMSAVPKFKAFRCALGDTNKAEVINRNEFEPSSSLLPMTNLHKKAFPFTVEETPETVEVRRLDDVVRNLSIEDNILTKIDVQGYEDRLISGGENLISRAKVLIVEVSFQTLYHGQPLFDEIYQILKHKGFSYVGSLDQLRSPLDGSVLQADAIFLRQ